MGLVDIDGFGSVAPMSDIELSDESKSKFQADDFDKTLVKKMNGLVKFEAINRKFSLGKLLKGYGCKINSQNMFCPFHDDEYTGKPSAKYHPDTDRLYCFSESKSYTAYHALKILYNYNMDEVFDKIWYGMSESERREIVSKYDSDFGYNTVEEKPSVWEKYKEMLKAFQRGEVNYIQFKNALYKTFVILSKESKKEDNKEE